MTAGRALVAGAVGAAAVTATNEVARRLVDDAPRLDLLGQRAVSRLRGGWGVGRLWPARRREDRRLALAGDLASNALYYALAARGQSPRLWRGLWLGVLAGVGAVALGPRLGLGHRPTDAALGTAAMTVAWYAIGGLAAGVAARWLAARRGAGAGAVPLAARG